MIMNARRAALAALALAAAQPARGDEPAQPTADDTVVVRARLDAARNGLSPTTGTSSYRIDTATIDELPQGTATSFNQVLEQAPGVARDSFGQLHVRGEHANLQYRIDGVLLPEGISGFGQVLDSRIVDEAELLTGALPAQYGDRTAGVVDIRTKSGGFSHGGSLDLWGGSRATVQPSVDYAGSSGALTYFAAASYLGNDQGIESPTSAAGPRHDHTDQGKAFAYFSDLLDDDHRLDAIAGTQIGQFQLPDNPGQTAAFTLDGATDLASAAMNERQREENHYGILALQGRDGGLDYQIAPYFRYSRLHFSPDPVGDLEFNGIASDVVRSNFASGLQTDASLQAGTAHTLRSGFTVQHERAGADNSAAVFPLDGEGIPLSRPVTVIDDTAKDGMLYGVYLQDEWRVSSRVTLNYGLRFDQVAAYVSENQTSPRLGLVYDAGGGITLHAGYARYFTPPPLELVASTSVTRFAGTTGAPAISENDPVRSERSHNFDLGVIRKIGSSIELGLDGYYKRVRNLLDEGQFGAALVYTPFNYAKGRIMGGEATASYRDETVNGYVNLAVSRAVGQDIVSSQVSFDDPEELAYIRDHWVHLDHDQLYTASAGFSYRLLPDTRVSLDGLVGSGLRKDFANTGHLPWYATFNLGARQHVAQSDGDGFDVRIAVVNLFDASYQLRSGSGIGVGAPQFGERRGYYAGISRNF